MTTERQTGLADCCGGSSDANAQLKGTNARLKITGLKAIGVTIDPQRDRPYVFIKIQTDAGIVGWGEATLEGKAGAVIATISDLREFLIGRDPMPVEHHWQSIFVHSFYRAGPILGSALSPITWAG